MAGQHGVTRLMMVVCGIALSGPGCGDPAIDPERLKDILEALRPDRPPRESQPPPRLIAPLSGARLSTNQPQLRWQLAGKTDGAVVEICADRACGYPLSSIAADGDRVSVAEALPAGAVFWRARGTRHGKVVTAPSRTWQMFLPHRTAVPSAALAMGTDVDGDGYCDFLLNDRVLRGGPDGYAGQLPLPPGTPGVAATSIAIAGDIDGNGFGDLMRLEATTEMTTFGIWSPRPLLSTAGTFLAGAADDSLMPSGSIYDLGPAGDVNGDGYGDVLLKTRFDEVTYLGGAAAMSSGSTPAAETSQSFFGFGGDINGDGFSDAASTSNGVASIVVTAGSAAGFAPTWQTIVLPAEPVTGLLALVDTNSDGFSDLAVTRGAGGVDLFAGDAGGLAATPFQTLPAVCEPEACATTPALYVVASGDFNGDGWSDLVVRGSQAFLVHYGRAGGVEPAGTPLVTVENTSVSTSSGAVGDVNGDGIDDLTATLFETDPQTGQSHVAAAILYLGGAGGLGAPSEPVR